MSLEHLCSLLKALWKHYKTWIILGIIILFPAFLIFLEPDVGSGLVFLSFVFAFYREGFPGGFLFFGFMLIFLIILSLMLSPMVVLITIIIVALISLFVLRWNISEVIIGGISIICFYLILFYINKFFLKTYSSYQILLAAFGIAGITGLIIIF